MRRSVDLDIGRDQYTAAYPNRLIIHKCAIHVDDNIIAQKDVLAVIAVKRRIDRDIFSNAAELFELEIVRKKIWTLKIF